MFSNDDDGDDKCCFVELMEQAGHLQRCNDKSDTEETETSGPLHASYQQTLLGALEAEQIGLHHLHHLLNDLNALPESGSADSDNRDSPSEDGPSEDGPSEDGPSEYNSALPSQTESYQAPEYASAPADLLSELDTDLPLTAPDTTDPSNQENH